MIIEIKKRVEIKDVIKAFEAKYGSFERLERLVKGKECEDPEAVDDHQVWKALEEGKEYIESIKIENPEVLTVLTPKRIELLEYLKKRYPKSIKGLAEELKRDYKNVYEDLAILSDYKVVAMKKKGRSTIPVCNVKEILVDLEA